MIRPAASVLYSQTDPAGTELSTLTHMGYKAHTHTPYTLIHTHTHTCACMHIHTHTHTITLIDWVLKLLTLCKRVLCETVLCMRLWLTVAITTWMQTRRVIMVSPLCLSPQPSQLEGNTNKGCETEIAFYKSPACSLSCDAGWCGPRRVLQQAPHSPVGLARPLCLSPSSHPSFCQSEVLSPTFSLCTLFILEQEQDKLRWHFIYFGTIIPSLPRTSRSAKKNSLLIC